MVDEDVEVWKEETGAAGSADYFSPLRPGGYDQAPPIFDDWYALALSVWSLYAGERPFESHRNNRRTIDLMRVQDEEVREWIRGILKQGGALV
ncbi:hypothetical protein TWF694_002087 [Orbilia ellipsospora]|uniref:Protein kinase domain-containing protein n=1 Tax=Orbilia ellipsospora TaxID=2528407 RepID=A0AAV9X4H0_9PEZI